MIDLTTVQTQKDSPRRLLLIEDDSSVVASLRLFLKMDYEVHAASTRKAGISLFRDLRPSLVVLDLRLPDGDGLDVLREIRTVSADAPVVVLTGYATMKSVEESLRLGASDFLHKPFDGFTLKSRIDALVSEIHRPIPAKAEGVPGSLEDALRQMKELELKANVSDMFLHDAASPVMASFTAAQFLCEEIERNPDCVSQDAREMTRILMKSMGLIFGLFEQSRSITCLSRLETSEFTVQKIINLALDLTQAKAQRRRVMLSVRVQKPRARVRTNLYVMVRVLLNLLSNAIEAVNEGSGRVTLLVTTVGGDVEFSVIDNGPGIAEHLMDRIFEAHFTTKQEGSGLGLYISRHLITNMGGSLTVRNMPGIGCCFSMRIPQIV